MQVAIPEFDGRIIGVPISFKEPLRGLRRRRRTTRPTPSAATGSRGSRSTTRGCGRWTAPSSAPRSCSPSFPTKHARVGQRGRPRHARQRDGAAATRCATPGTASSTTSRDGDALIHALIAAGGHDPEFLSDAQLRRARRAPAGRATTLRGSTTLPAALHDRDRRARGARRRASSYVDGDDFVIAGLDLGNVFVAIQPPRGYGEDPVAIYHDPEPRARPPLPRVLPLARRSWGADAIVHLGKHGTLEWLPGKALGLSAACAPDAVPRRRRRSSTRSSSTTPARACRPSAAPTPW